MLSLDEDALVCDFAETYHIYDLWGLPVDYAATLASGLRENSRIKMRLAGTEITTDTALLARIVDNTRVLIWAKTKDAETGKNYPESILEKLTGREKETEDTGFSTAEEFEAARNRILGKG